MIKLNLSFLLLLLPYYLFGQTFVPKADWRFDNFSSQNHFTSRLITNIAFDRYGYLWAAGRGVHRFDGARTVDFTSYNPAPGSLKDNYTDVIADCNGRIWVSSLGLCYYDDISDKFVYVFPVPQTDFNYAYALLPLKNNLRFVGAQGLARVDINTLKISYTSLKKVTDPLLTYPVDDNTLLISSRENIYIYHIKEDTYTPLTLIYKQAKVRVSSVVKKGGGIILGTSRGLFTFNNLKDVVPEDTITEDLAINDMFFMPGDKEKKYLVISTEHKGLMVYNTIKRKMEFNYVHDDGNPYSLASNQLLKLFADKQGRLWIGTNVGISMLDLFNQQWKMRFINQNSAYVADVRKIAVDKFDSTKVWIAPYNRGLVAIDWQTKKIKNV